MIKITSSTFLIYFLYTIWGAVEAACLRQVYTNPNENTFKYSYLCTSSFEELNYEINRVITDDMDLQIFTFDPIGRGGTCYSIEWRIQNEKFCFNASVSEELVYQTKHGRFEIRPRADYDRLSETIQSRETIFMHPMGAAQTTSPCNIYLLDNGDVFIFSDVGFPAISECLLRMEIFLTENPEALLRFYQ